MVSEELLREVLKKTLSNGGEYADIYVSVRRVFSGHWEDQKLEKLIQGTDAGVGVRLIYRGKTFFGYTNSFDAKDLRDLAQTVSAAAKENLDREISLIKKSPSVVHPYRVLPESVPVNEKIEVLKRMDRVARGYSSLIKQVLCLYREAHERVQILNSDGTLAEDDRLYTILLAQVVASEGSEIQTGYEPRGGLIGLEFLEESPPEEIAEAAAQRAVMMLRARKAPGGRMPVVISSEAGGTMIHEAVGHGLEADLACEGLSVYHGRLGQKVASDVVTVRDEAALQNKRDSLCFNDEGTEAQRTVLIEKGILKGFMTDRYNAIKHNLPLTGNGRRESYRHRPIPRMTNTLIAPGPHRPEDIISQVKEGLFVKKMGGGQVNTITGDFVFEVQEGYIIKNGQVDEPVRGATLTGNGPEVLMSIEMVGSDLGFAIGTCGKDGQGVPVSDAMPTVLISEMVVGGEA
ncbi:MAG: TldD/PmbA family protein [Nitrospirae bacterium]|nr:MAG: TldD/PmbA family protein [Nitrospirota bacterium]